MAFASTEALLQTLTYTHRPTLTLPHTHTHTHTHARQKHIFLRALDNAHTLRYVHTHHNTHTHTHTHTHQHTHTQSVKRQSCCMITRLGIQLVLPEQPDLPSVRKRCREIV